MAIYNITNGISASSTHGFIWSKRIYIHEPLLGRRHQIILFTLGRMRKVTLCFFSPSLSVLYAHQCNSAVLPQAKFPFPKGMPSRIQSAVRGYGGSGSDSGPAYRTTINHLPAPVAKEAHPLYFSLDCFCWISTRTAEWMWFAELEGGWDDWTGVGGDVAQDSGMHRWDGTSTVRQQGHLCRFHWVITVQQLRLRESDME